MRAKKETQRCLCLPPPPALVPHASPLHKRARSLRPSGNAGCKPCAKLFESLLPHFLAEKPESNRAPR